MLGYSPLKSGAALLPVAVALMIAAPSSAGLVRAFGTKRVVAAGLLIVAVALLLFSRVTTTSGYGLVGAVLVIVGLGMGLAMAPATDSIMGSVPPDKAGVGSAMNDTTREIGGALGVAILGSITNAVYTSTITGEPAFAALKQASPQVAGAVQESIGSAVIAAQAVGGAAAASIQQIANQAFVDALSPTVIVAAIVAVGGAIVAYLFLPARAATTGSGDPLVDAAVERAPISDAQRRDLASLTLGMLADAGMSSLTYHAIAARSGVSAATLQANWPSRVAAVSDAVRELYEARPVPDTGDLAADLDHHLRDLAHVLAAPRARQVLGALIAEAASDPELAAALRAKVVEPRRAALAARLAREPQALTVPVEAAVDLLVGPIYHRALIAGAPPDDDFVDAITAAVLAAPPAGVAGRVPDGPTRPA